MSIFGISLVCLDFKICWYQNKLMLFVILIGEAEGERKRGCLCLLVHSPRCPQWPGGATVTAGAGQSQPHTWVTGVTGIWDPRRSDVRCGHGTVRPNCHPGIDLFIPFPTNLLKFPRMTKALCVLDLQVSSPWPLRLSHLNEEVPVMGPRESRLPSLYASPP